MNITKKSTVHKGFTIVELLVVIVVIGILAAITIVAYDGIQKRAHQAKIDSDIATIVKAVNIARTNNGTNLFTITGTYTEEHCNNQVSGTDLAALPQTHDCWKKYNESLDKVSIASGMDIRQLKDPWGRPYYFNENEGEGSWATCDKDVMGVYQRPHVQSSATIVQTIPLYTSAC